MNRFTTGNRHFTECRRLCQVYFIEHSAKTVFAECQIKYTRQNKHSTKCVFAECLFLALGKYVFCRVLFFGTRQNTALPSAFFLTLGKYVFCQVLFSGTRQRCILPSAFVLALGKEAFYRVHFFFGPRQISFSKQFLRP